MFLGPDPYGTSGNDDLTKPQSPVDIRLSIGRTHLAYLLVNGPLTIRDRDAVEAVIRTLGARGEETVTIIFRENGAIIDNNVSDVDAQDGILAQQISPGVILLKIPTAGLTSDMLADSIVTASKIAANAVTTNAIADGSITTPKIANGAVVQASINSHAVTNSELGNGAVDWRVIANSLVGNGANQLAPGAGSAIIYATKTLGYASHAVGTGLGTIDSVNYGPLVAGVTYDLYTYVMGQVNAASSGFCTIYANTGVGSSIGGMRVGTVGGERPCAALAVSPGILGDGVTIYNAQLRATGGGVAGSSIMDGIIVALAFPRS